VNDGGIIKRCLIFFTMACGTSPVRWNDKLYHYFVPWVVDPFHTGKGIGGFLPLKPIILELRSMAKTT